MDGESDDDGLSYASFEGHLVSTLVLAEVEPVATALAALVPGGEWQPAAAGRAVELRPRSYLVVRYAGRRWTTVLAWQAWRDDDWDQLGEARGLSKALKTKAIAYSCADSAGDYRYELFRNGKRIEQYYCGEEDREPFRSTFRDESWTDDWDPYSYLDTFFRDQKAYEPGWGFDDFFRGPSPLAVGERVIPLADESVERLYWVAGPPPQASDAVPGAATDGGGM